MFSKQGKLRSLTRRFRRRAPERVAESVDALFARRRRKHFTGKVIAITGSSGKSSTAELLAHILAGHGKTQAQVVNNTFGPVAKALRRAERDSEYFVIEAGTTAKGELKRIAQLIDPDVAVVTMVAIEHYTAFRNIDAIFAEKRAVVEALRPGGLAVLNRDDPNVIAMREGCRARVVTYGRQAGADYHVTNIQFEFPGPLRLTISSTAGTHVVETSLIGEHFWNAVAAVFATAVELGVPPAQIIDRCRTSRTVEGRSQLVELNNGVTFLLDTAKSPWHSFATAIEPLRSSKAKRRFAVVGHIADYSGNSTSKYRKAYSMLRELTESVMFVGENSHKAMPDQHDVQTGRYQRFDTVVALNEHLKQTLTHGDLVFVKGSKNLHLERLGLAWQHDVKCWVDKCGWSIGCRECGLFEHPFEQHAAIRKKDKLSRRVKATIKDWIKWS